MRALHGYSLLGACAGNDIWRLPLPLQSLLDGSRIRRHVGQLVEHVTFADDGVHQVAVSWRADLLYEQMYTTTFLDHDNSTKKGKLLKSIHGQNSLTIKLVLDNIVESLQKEEYKMMVLDC